MVGPVLDLTGWAVEPLTPDTYSGLAGLAVLFAAYQREATAGRADALDEAPALLAATLRTLRAVEDYASHRRSQTQIRPPPVGGYIGLGSQIWAWLTLRQWGVAPDGLARACALAGAIVPLLQLSAATGERRWQHEAAAIGDRLALAAERKDGSPGPHRAGRME